MDNTDNSFTARHRRHQRTFSIDANGAWTFVGTGAFNEMNVGDSKVESFTVTSVDAHRNRESDHQWHERCARRSQATHPMRR
ncbi:VCBS domain-containing protein [Vibrio vulnificus]|uniref:VCBS domain-containing protein n=1 Tax=Vibrio vulnificus TaxID=672 RepID=UPI000B7C61F3